MRTAQDIKLIYKKLKVKTYARAYHKSHPLTGDRLALKRARDVEKVTRLHNSRKERGLCIRCSTEAVILSYEYKGLKLLTRKALYCPKHWESETIRKEMHDAMASNSTIHTVHPMVTLSNKPNANNTSKHS